MATCSHLRLRDRPLTSGSKCEHTCNAPRTEHYTLDPKPNSACCNFAVLLFMAALSKTPHPNKIQPLKHHAKDAKSTTQNHHQKPDPGTRNFTLQRRRGPSLSRLQPSRGPSLLQGPSHARPCAWRTSRPKGPKLHYSHYSTILSGYVPASTRGGRTATACITHRKPHLQYYS